MTKKAAAWLLVLLGGILLGVGIFLGTASINRVGVDCGSGFGGVSDAATIDDYTRAIEADHGLGLDRNLSSTEDTCGSAVSDRKTIAYVVTVPGAVILVAGLVVAVSARPTAPLNNETAP